MKKLSPDALLIAAVCAVALLLGLLIRTTPAGDSHATQTDAALAANPETRNGAPQPQSSNAPKSASGKKIPAVALITLKTPATISIGAQKQTIQANAIGFFPRLRVDPKTNIPIHLQVQPHELVREEVLDGGGLDDKSQIKFQYSDAYGNLDFDYLIRDRPGNYRVAVYRQGLRQILNFWVGPDLPPRVPASND